MSLNKAIKFGKEHRRQYEKMIISIERFGAIIVDPEDIKSDA